MNINNNKTPFARLWQQVKGEAKLHGADFWQMPLISVAAALLMAILLGGVLLFVEDTSAPEMVGLLISLVPVIVAVGLGCLISATLFTVYYKLGLQMGQTRRNMLLRLSILSLVMHVVTVGFAAALSCLLAVFYSHFFAPTDVLLALVPWWGWVLMLTLPLAIGMLGGAILMRFGRKGFWVMYGIFMSLLLLPQLFTGMLDSWNIDLWVERIAAFTLAMPHVVCLISLLPFAIGAALLWHLPLKD